jgi:hypothetical protein
MGLDADGSGGLDCQQSHVRRVPLGHGHDADDEQFAAFARPDRFARLDRHRVVGLALEVSVRAEEPVPVEHLSSLSGTGRHLSSLPYQATDMAKPRAERRFDVWQAS